jgi:hypothetical protein
LGPNRHGTAADGASFASNPAPFLQELGDEEGGVSERQPYSRVYWSIRTDPKFEQIYGDDRHLATWLRLLIAADATWPAPADVPASARKLSVAALVEAKLIDLLPSGMFKVRGLDAERGRRRDAARDSADARYGRTPNASHSQSERSPNGVLAEPSQAEDETRRAEGEASRATEPPDVYWTLTGRYPSDKPLSWIDDLSSKYGDEAVIRAIARAHTEDRNVSTLLGRAQDILRSEARALDLKAQAVQRELIAAKRAEPRIVPDREAVNAELRKLMEVAA